MSRIDRQKSKPFPIRLAESERRELERRAGEMALGAYIKATLFSDGDKRRHRGARAPIKDHQKLAEVLAALGASRIGESLRRLADAAESGTLTLDDDAPAAIKRACEDIVVIRLLLMRALGFQIPDTETNESASQTFARAARED